MSQNSQTLLLFFEDKESFRNCLGMLKNLETGDENEAKKFSDQLQVDISHTWHEDWFNHVVRPRQSHINLYYETGTSYELPTDVLLKLSDAGLKAACLEVFYDQVGEYGQFYFTKTHLVDADNFFKKYPDLRKIISSEFEMAPDELENDGYSRPITIKKLIKNRERQLKETEEMMENIKDMSRAFKDSGLSLDGFIKSALFLSAIKKGLLHASIFGVITVLLFKGIWLWIGLSIVLAVILPFVYFDDTAFYRDDDEADSGLESGSE